MEAGEDMIVGFLKLIVGAFYWFVVVTGPVLGFITGPILRAIQWVLRKLGFDW